MSEIDNIVKQLIHQRSAIERAILALMEINRERAPEPVALPAPAVSQPRKRTMSAAARKRIGNAARKRWALKKAADTAAKTVQKRKARKKKAA